MKKTFQTSLLSSLLLASFAHANDVDTSAKNHWSVGVGSYAFSITNDDNSAGDINFTGLNISAGYAVNNHFQIKGGYFSLENDENSSVESTGLDLMAYGGTGFSERGFKGYGGAGFYSDKWEAPGLSESFSGFQLGGGLGYNWGPVALDLVVTLRQVDEYEDFFYLTGEYVAASGNLSVSYLF